MSKKDNMNADAFFKRGNSYAKKEEYDKAIADYNQAIELKPDYAEAFNNRGTSYAEKGDYDKAIEDYNQAIELNSNDANIFYNRGNSYFKKEEYDKAIADYNQAIELKPNYADAFNNRGNFYAKKEDYDKAIADYDKAIELNPSFVVAIDNRGLALASRAYKEQLKKHEDSVSEIKKYEEREEAYEKKYKKLGIARNWLLGCLFLFSLGSYGYLIGFIVCRMKDNSSPIFFQYLPISILITLILSSLVWAIRLVNIDRDRALALKEDAYTKGISTLLINTDSTFPAAFKQEMTKKLFDYTTQHSTSEMIANWHKKRKYLPPVNTVAEKVIKLKNSNES